MPTELITGLWFWFLLHVWTLKVWSETAEAESEPKVLYSLCLLLDSSSDSGGRQCQRAPADQGISAVSVLGNASVPGQGFSWCVYLEFAQFDHCTSLKQGIN